MKRSLYRCLILGLGLTLGVGSGLAVADGTSRMAELQQSLNDEILAQPFSVAERKMPRPTPEDLRNQLALKRRHRERRVYVYPRVHLGWHFGHRSHHHGFYHGFHHRRFHRYHH